MVTHEDEVEVISLSLFSIFLSFFLSFFLSLSLFLSIQLSTASIERDQVEEDGELDYPDVLLVSRPPRVR